MYLDWRLKCTIVIMSYPSNCVQPVVVNFLNFDHWTDFKETWEEVSTLPPIPNSCFTDWSVDKDCHLCLWLADKISDLAEDILTKFNRKQDFNVLCRFSNKGTKLCKSSTERRCWPAPCPATCPVSVSARCPTPVPTPAPAAGVTPPRRPWPPSGWRPGPRTRVTSENKPNFI